MTKINEVAARFLEHELKQEMEFHLKENVFSGWKLKINEADPQTLRFVYPQSFSDSSILQEIRLESGAFVA